MRVILLFSFLFFLQQAFGQINKELHSVIEILSYSKSATLEEIKQSKAILEELETTKKAWAQKEIGKIFQLNNQYDSAIRYFNLSIENANESNSDSILSGALYQLSLVYLYQSEYQKAIDQASEALEIDKNNKDYKNIAASLNAIALIYQQAGVYDKALEFQIESIKVSEENNQSEDIANGYYNLGNIYLKFDEITKALEYFNLAENSYNQLLTESPGTSAYNLALSETYYSRGEVYLRLKKYNSALEQFKKTIEIKSSYNDLLGLSNAYNRLSDTYSYLGNNDEAIRILFSMSLPLKIQLGDKKGIAVIYSNLGRVHFNRNDLNSAENFLLKSNVFAQQIDDKEIIVVNAKLLSDIYQQQNKLKKALEFQQLYATAKDSLILKNNRKIVEENSVRFETDKKEKENQILSLTVQREKTVRNYLAGIILLALFIVVVIFRYSLKNKRNNIIISKKNSKLKEQNIQINNQKAVIEAKNKDLTGSIAYAQKIQKSMLSKSDDLNERLQDVFILFKPKDLVSGDFYWTGEKDNKFIISAIDCTGHGVPGGFLSMLGDSYLNQIVYNLGITSPEQILTELDKNIKIALKQKDTKNQDGMDMAICSIDLKTKTVEYAGAKNPLVYIKNGEVTKIKASRSPIGGFGYKEIIYEKHIIEVDNPTCFYMFSDGYQDQFGGPENRKFMYRNLEKLFLENHERSFSEQHQILEETINNWKKDYDQTDDILVVGFKLF